MGPIAYLPRSLVNQLRSGSILPDLAQALEELICNSIDAGATKVYAFVDISSSFVKVEDDGSGITRDDLALVGERHATSKLHCLMDLEAGLLTLGFRGESLSSLSDIAVLEVTSRTRGSPNTYRKIMKDCKALSIGLCSEQRAPGTTVILRDLFYNLPVRRKAIISSPRKVLQSAREHVIRLALIHPNVSFTLIDLSRQESLIHTRASLSPLSSLCVIFGEELCAGLQELKYSKGNLSLSGFISSRLHWLPTRGIQYLYINRRFVQKTPVHKLLNTFSCISSHNPNVKDSFFRWAGRHEANAKTEMIDISLKHAFPAFVLNLSCPLSSYDITFEPTKTTVEFKDWTLVLSFVKDAIDSICGASNVCSMEGMTKEHPEMSSYVTTKSSSTHKRKVWQRIDPTYRPSYKIGLPNANASDQGHLLSKCQFIDDEGVTKFDGDCFGTPRSLTYSCKRKDDHFSKSEVNFSGQELDIWTYAMNESPSQNRISCACNVQSSNNVKKNRDAECNNFFASAEGTVDPLVCDISGSSLLGNAEFMEPVVTPTSTLDVLPESSDSFSPSVCNTTIKYGLDEDNVLDSQHSPPWSPRVIDGYWGEHDGPSCQFLKESGKTLQHPLNSTLGIPMIATKKMRCDQRQLDVNYTNCFEDNSIIILNSKGSFDTVEATCPRKFQMDEVELLNCDILEKSDMTAEKKERCFSNGRSMEITQKSYEQCGYRELQEMQYGIIGSKQEERDQKCCLNYASWPPSEGFRGALKCADFKHSCYTEAPASQCLDLDVMDFTPNSSVILQQDYLRKKCHDRRPGSKNDRNLCLNETAVHQTTRTKLQRSLSGPPFYKPCKKYGLPLTSGFSLLKKNQSQRNTTAVRSTCERKAGVMEKPLWVGNDGNALEASAHPFNSISVVRDCQEEVSLQDDIQVRCLQTELDADPVNVTVTELYQDWVNPCLALNDRDILDLSSGILGPINQQLLPESISKESLQNARVLRQLGKKFIAVVTGGILLVVDQHAADERIQLEHLREEVLLENKKQSSTLLEQPQELSVTFRDQQLLQTYHSQIEDWGWRFKTFPEPNEFLHRRIGQAYWGTYRVFLSAVPCILGESIGDRHCLIEYLHQLAETDGSSAPPPAVLRLLASKACRGAIMFGDLLLQAECQQLINGLKRTALCFQCAHGRPTSVPLVNLHALHKRLERSSADVTSESTISDRIVYSKEPSCHSDRNIVDLEGREEWHSLRWHRPTLERAHKRLNQAEEM